MLSWLTSFSLGTPLFLIGALAGAIPIIIHMIYTRKAPIILFSTVRFLKIAARKTARRRKVEDLMLLIFRVLLFSLLAMALAQPFFRSGGFELECLGVFVVAGNNNLACHAQIRI